MQTAIANELVQPFCDDEDGRYAMREPFVQSGYLCATNGRAAIRVPTSEPDTIADDKRFPNIAGVCSEYEWDKQKWQPWPVRPNVVQSEMECRKCKGSGFKVFRECNTCNGAGEIECDKCGHIEECYCENGLTGTGTCSACNGKGECFQPDVVEFGGVRIAHRYYEAVKALPRPLEYSVFRDAMLFRAADGVHGIVMQRIEAD